MGEGSGAIIIKGGSVEVIFASSLYGNVPGDPSKHKSDNRKITKVKVEDENGKALFDSDTNSDGLKWTITVYTA